MFRIKKGGDAQEPVAAERPEVAEEEPVAKAPPRRALPIPARPLGSANFPIDIGRRGDVAGGPGRSDPSPAVGRDKCLVVGKDVRLQGQVLACDKIIVEGEADIVLTGCRSLQIGASGVFRGTAEVGEAEIAGQFDGELVIRERLAVRATGKLRGKIRYGQITIDAGGQVSGEISTLDAQPASAPAGSAAAAGGGAEAPAIAGSQAAPTPADRP